MKQRSLLIYAVLLAVLSISCDRRQAGLQAYHEALSLIDQGDAPAALEQLQRAAAQAQTDSLLALCHSQMGTLYFSQRLLDRAIDSYRRAYAIDLRARDTLGLVYDLRDMGNVLRATDDRQDSCLIYFARARRLAQAAGHVAMQRDVESQMAAYYLYHDELAEARRLLMPAMQHIGEANQSGLLFMMADLYRRSGQRDSATLYYRELLSRGNVFTRQAAHRALAEYCLADGLADEAAEHLRLYEQLTDSVHKQNDAEGVRRTAAIYDYSLRQQEAARLRWQLTLSVAVLLLLLLALLSVLLYYSRRRMHYRLKVARLEQLLADYRRDPPAPAVETKSGDTEISQQIDRFLSDAHPQVMGDADFHLLEATIEEHYPAFLSRLQEFCHLTPQERRVCLLLKQGVAPAAIAQLTAHSKQSVTNTRSRLYAKAFGRKGTPAEWDEFIRSL